MLSIALMLNAISVFSILPGGCVRQPKSKGIALAHHEIEVTVGQEFTVHADFGIESLSSESWEVIDLPYEIELVNVISLKRFPPITVWAFKTHELGNYTISFKNSRTQDIMHIHVHVYSPLRYIPDGPYKLQYEDSYE